MACGEQPTAKMPIIMPEMDGLNDTEKIDLLSQQSSTLSASGLAAVAKLYQNRKLYSNALNAINEAIMLDPMNSSFHSMKAEYAYMLGNKSTAYRESLTAYQLGSKSLKQSLNLAKMAVVLSEFTMVGNIIDSLLITYPSNPDVLYLAARKYDKDGKTVLAENNYRKVYKDNPENFDNNYFFTEFLVEQGEFISAMEVVSMIDSLKQTKSTYILKGDIYYALQLFDSAAIWYQYSLSMEADTTTYNKTIKSYELAELTDSVINISEAAISSFPTNKFYLYTAAKNLDNRFRYDESLEYYLTLYQLDTLDTLVGQELDYLQRKIAYLQRRKVEQKKLADSLNKVLPILTF